MVTTRAQSTQVQWPAVRARSGKSVSTWLLYTLNGFLVLTVGLFVFIMWKRDEYNIGWKYTPAEGKPIPQLLIFAIPMFLLAILVEDLYWRFKGVKRLQLRMADLITSLNCGVYQQNTAAVFFGGLGLMPYAWVRERTAILWRDEEVTPLNWILTFVLLEYGYYWLHRFAHEFNVMWAGHIVHHSGTDYNLATALRQSWWQGVYSWSFYMFMAPFLPVALFAWHSQFNLIYQFWIHTQTVYKMWWPIEFIFNTASHHRVHHGRQPHYIDKNYGGTLIVFDRLFGTFQEEDVEVVYGVTTDDFDSWNVLWLQHSQFLECWRTFKKMLALRHSGEDVSLLDCARVWLDRGPGFNYEILKPELIASPPPVVTPRTERKYDNKMPNFVCNVYGFVHGMTILPSTIILLLSGRAGPVALSWLSRFAVWVVSTYSMFCIGALFDNKGYAKTVETLRLVGIAAGSHWLLNSADSPIPPKYQDVLLENGAFIWAAGFSVCSLGVLHTAYKVAEKKKVA